MRDGTSRTGRTCGAGGVPGKPDLGRGVSRWGRWLSAMVLLFAGATPAPAASLLDGGPPPYEYDPYHVLIWVASSDGSIAADAVRSDLRELLRRETLSPWRIAIADAPAAVRIAADRDLGRLDYEAMIAADPVIAVRRDHPDAVRIRTMDNVAEFVKQIVASEPAAAEFRSRLSEGGRASGEAVAAKFVTPEQGRAATAWSAEGTEAVLIDRGAATLLDPEPKLIDPPLEGLVRTAVEGYDKIFVVRVRRGDAPSVAAVEMDTLMRHVSPPVVIPSGGDRESTVAAIGEAVTASFRPIVRVDNAGRKDISGIVRAAKLVPEGSPMVIRPGDVLMPMLRKDDRNHEPFVIGPLDWSYLVVTQTDGPLLEADYYSALSGGLQGRKNNRTYRMALRVNPTLPGGSTLRLHEKGRPDKPLIGYELHERPFNREDYSYGKEMSFVGRTDWDGRLNVPTTDTPMRLLYVKNGGAVLARLPVVPGLNAVNIADLSGDDDRLAAEAYVRGVRNSIIDLVAIRKLYEARVKLRLEKGEIDKAKELMQALREQPTGRELGDALAKRQAAFVKEIDSPSQKRKVDFLFSQTREMLAKFINPKMLNDLETEMAKVE